MTSLVVVESSFGNTRAVAEAITEGLGPGTVLVDVGEAPDDLSGFDLVVVGGPTHAFGMSRPSTRDDAARQAGHEPGGGPGIREWIAALPRPAGGTDRPVRVATFDTRVAKVRHLPGSAAKGAAKALAGHGYARLGRPTSFYVSDTPGPLLDGEADRARAWGTDLARLPG